LTKLEMQGFKSFADTTTMVFEEGVTAIVGPNGCGKSNVSDAVRWVLGEQRARMLRGAKMEEVIFQGSSARHPVNVAEVSLFFDNSEGFLPIAFREVVITRRLSRSGDSDYLLNGSLCRLRDIHDLLRGTGLGSDAGVVIEAKMIDALLSDRPDERRELFEEAAGVGLYRDRRRSTERRLEETAVDLARLDDLLNEVQSQVRSLARQRKRAERHAELRARRFAVDLTLASREMDAWRDELTRLETTLATLRASGPIAEQAVVAAEHARVGAHEKRSAAEAKRGEVGRAVQQALQRVQELRAEIAVAVERQRHAAERKQRAEDERLESRASGERISEERARAHGELAARTREVTEADEALRAAVANEEIARDAVIQRREELQRAEATLREAKDTLRSFQLDREAAQREIVELEARAHQLDAERGELLSNAQTIAREITLADEQVALTTETAATATGAAEAARHAARQARAAGAAARSELVRSEDHSTALQGKVNALESLERERVGLAPAAARLLTDRAEFGEGAILGPLSDFLSSSAASAVLLERFLGMTLHAVVVRDGSVTDAVRAWHGRVNPGPLLLLPVDAVGNEAAGDGDLLGLVDAQREAKGWARALLEHVHTLADGTAFVDARGAVWLPGATAGPGPLRRRADLFAFRAELQVANDARQSAAHAAELARGALEAAENSATSAADAAASAQLEERHAIEVRAELDRRRLRVSREIEESSALEQRLRNRQKELVHKTATVEEKARRAQSLLGDHEQGVIAARQQLAQVEAALEMARDARAAQQVAVAQAQARRDVTAEALTRLDRDLEGASARLAVLHTELETLALTDRELAEQLATWQADLDQRSAVLTAVETQMTAAEHAVYDADARVAAADHELDARRREAHDVEATLHQSELRFIELSGKRTAIRERLETEWRRPLEDLLVSYDPVDLFDDALREEADKLREEMDKLGPVNPLAVEEHQEELKRFEFLTNQRNDLSEARSKLQLAIREIDTTARDMFLETFSRIRENFRQIFLTLFGGGECDLRLENTELPLDCDIEIHASPRGKRTQRIHLLSSGERALVALSLLFGIFLTKPSPFCLLDEVDAPLDDANIGRFVRMLTQFKAKTQFIVITHNPRTTTEASDAVYGVTMQEPGVSSLVSVRMRGSAIDDVETGDVMEVTV
jgi:chromosome segregation protein